MADVDFRYVLFRTHGTTQFPAASDPYANGGDLATHTTGLALTYNGYGFKGWLGVQKMKEIKQLVIDGVTPQPVVVPNVVGMTGGDLTATAETISRSSARQPASGRPSSATWFVVKSTTGTAMVLP